MKKYFKQHANLSRANTMETGDHFKNGGKTCKADRAGEN
jgi:hypothetical protein